MKKILILLLIWFGISCEDRYNRYHDETYRIRQLVKSKDTTKHASGSFFLITGGYSSTEKTELKVNMFIETKDGFKMVSINLSTVIVRIDNSIDKPYLRVTYWNSNPRSIADSIYDAEVWGDSSFNKTKIIIHCPEKYLPERLLPLEL